MIKPEDLEELRRYFQPKTETVTSLPEVKSVRDLTLVILKDGATRKLYIAFEGQWKLIATLS